MEVHHHGHVHEKKKWKEYLFQFLMLFLAVFCGFLAEYQLEHKIEKAREQQYIQSFAEDMEADVVEYKNKITACDQTINIADSLILLLSRPDKDKWANDIYYYSRLIHRSNEFSTNDRTIIQLRNAGGMRLISSKSVSDSMVDYYKIVESVRFIYEEQIDYKRTLRSHFPEFLDGIDYGKVVDEYNKVIRPDELLKLKPTDPNTINTCIIILQNIKGINQGIKRRLEQMKKRAEVIREFILKEYHLE